jgi:hypothetical protein
MRSWKVIILFFTAVLLLPICSYATDLSLLRISLIDKDVQIKTEETDEWTTVAINTPLQEGDRLRVSDKGKVELQFRGRTYIRLRGDSLLEILAIEDGSAEFYLTKGHAYINYNGKGDNLLQLDTPFSSIRAYDDSKFRIDVAGDGFTEVAVFKGDVYVENRDGRTKISSGKSISIGEDYAELSLLGPSDEWERWNYNRDKRLSEKSYSSRYLPEELDDYSSDFDENGKWVYVREYGYVWTPTIISIQWAPYRVGRWVWIGSNYVWISYEPWGWVPYHYGRWTFVVSIGWCWVPPLYRAVYWGPGFVGWIYTPTYVAWVPLAPGEVYYRPSSVNIININKNKTVVKSYKNMTVNNAITTVDRDTFIKSKKMNIEVKGKPIPKDRLNEQPRSKLQGIQIQNSTKVIARNEVTKQSQIKRSPRPDFIRTRDGNTNKDIDRPHIKSENMFPVHVQKEVPDLKRKHDESRKIRITPVKESEKSKKWVVAKRRSL